MLHTLLNNVLQTVRTRARLAVAGGAVLAGVAGLPSAAMAHHGFFVDVPPVTPVVVEPVPCGPVPERVWVEPVYRTVCDRVWVPAVTVAQPQQVYVPDQFGWRDAVVYDRWGHARVVRERVLLTPAHYESQPAVAVVTAGHFEDVPRQELVSAGHWERTCAPVYIAPPERPVFHLRLPF